MDNRQFIPQETMQFIRDKTPVTMVMVGLEAQQAAIILSHQARELFDFFILSTHMLKIPPREPDPILIVPVIMPNYLWASQRGIMNISDPGFASMPGKSRLRETSLMADWQLANINKHLNRIGSQNANKVFNTQSLVANGHQSHDNSSRTSPK
jgi:hypothetical protein